MTDGVVVSDEGHVRTVRMDRPKVKNALSSELAWGVVGAVEEAARDDSVWVVCLTGTGDAFCSGVDLRGSGDYHPHSPLTAQLDDLGWVSRFLLTLRRDCEKPVVCGVNGVAAGAGLALAMAADMRLLKRGARLVPGYPGIGASPDGGLTFTLAQAIGYERAFRFLLDPAGVDSDEALRLGMVGEVVDAADWDARLQEFCRRLCETVSPITMRLTKRTLVRATSPIDLEAHTRFELASIRMAFASEDSREARRAFLEKRPAAFTGR